MFHFQKTVVSQFHHRLRLLALASSLRTKTGGAPVEKALSFGCATGEEVLSLSALFPDASVYGCDIAEDALRIAQGASRFARGDVFRSTWEEVEARGPYDVILANAVFCLHPTSVKLDSIATQLPYSFFVEALGRLTALLNSGGLLIMSDANYPLACTPSAGELVPVQVAGNIWAGKVERFGPDGLKYAKFGTANGCQQFELIRELPATFAESLFDGVWWKRHESRASRFRVTCTPRIEPDPKTEVAHYARELLLTPDAVTNIIAQTLEVGLHRLEDGSVMQIENRNIVQCRDGQVLFREETAGVIDPHSGLITSNSPWIETAFWAQQDSVSAEWSRI